jgi:ribose transport system permease protein
MVSEFAASAARNYTGTKAKGEAPKRFLKAFIPYLGLIFILVFFDTVNHGRLLAPRNFMPLVNQIFYTAIGACGMAFVIAQGNLDFSMGAVAGFAAALAARAAGIDPLLAAPVALLVGLVVGAVNGIVHAILNVPSFIATLAMSFMLGGLVLQVLDSGNIGLPLSMLSWDNTLLKLGTLIVLLAVGAIAFEFTRFGKHSKAIGSRIDTAIQSGVAVRKMKILSFMATGLTAGIVGFFAVVRSGTATAITGGGLEMDALNALLLGGMPISGGANSKFRSVFIGSVMVAILVNGMTMWGLGTLVQQLVKGVIFIVAVALSFDRTNTAVIK